MKRVYVAIYLNEQKQPYEMRATDGDWVKTIPVSNTKLETVKRTAKQMFGRGCDIWVVEVTDAK